MQTLELEKLKYPIGKFEFGSIPTESQVRDYVECIHAFPSRLRKLVEQLNGEQLDTPYRPQGWTIRQVVHHVADSHINAYVRFKLAVTESNPTIKPYEEARWAELPDSKQAPVEISLKLVENIHERWVMFLKALSGKDWEKTYFHPQHQRQFRLNEVLSMYAWHCEHHYQHIDRLMKRMSW